MRVRGSHCSATAWSSLGGCSYISYSRHHFHSTHGLLSYPLARTRQWPWDWPHDRTQPQKTPYQCLQAVRTVLISLWNPRHIAGSACKRQAGGSIYRMRWGPERPECTKFPYAAQLL